MNNQKKYTITKEGYEKLLEELQVLKQQFASNELAMSQSFQNASGDGAHDNGEFETLQANEKLLARQINRLIVKIQNANIIDVPVLEQNK